MLSFHHHNVQSRNYVHDWKLICWSGSTVGGVRGIYAECTSVYTNCNYTLKHTCTTLNIPSYINALISCSRNITKCHNLYSVKHFKRFIVKYSNKIKHYTFRDISTVKSNIFTITSQSEGSFSCPAVFLSPETTKARLVKLSWKRSHKYIDTKDYFRQKKFFLILVGIKCLYNWETGHGVLVIIDHQFLVYSAPLKNSTQGNWLHWYTMFGYKDLVPFVWFTSVSNIPAMSWQTFEPGLVWWVVDGKIIEHC